VIQAYRGRSGSAKEGDFGALRVTVGDRDISELTLQMSIGASVRGSVRLDTTDLAPALFSADFKVIAIPTDLDESPQNNWAESSAPAGSFELNGLSGIRRLEVVDIPKGWAFKELRLNGVDITDRPLAMNGQPIVSGLEVVLTDRVSVLSGTVRDDRNRPVPSSSIVVFSTDRDRWYWRSRFLRLTTTTAEGAYSLEGLPAGSYDVAAISVLPKDGEDAWQDPEYLSAVSRAATTTTLRDGEHTNLDLRVQSDRGRQ